jgi:hypothetical protein
MQILYVEKLQSLGYKQHTYAIIGKNVHVSKNVLNTYLLSSYINNYHWIFVKIHMSPPNLHCTLYNSHTPMTKKLPSNTIQLLCKFINVNNLLYTYANVM